MTMLIKHSISKLLSDFYSENIDVLSSFVNSKKDGFSDQQRTWLKWAVKEVGSKGNSGSLASND